MTSAQMPARSGRHRRTEAPAVPPPTGGPAAAPPPVVVQSAVLQPAIHHAGGQHPAIHQPAVHQPAVHHPAAHPPLGPHGAAQRFAADAVRAAVDALAFAEAQWDLEAWRAAHAAALDLVVLLAAIGPGPEVLLNSAAATLDNARRLVDSGNTQGGDVTSVPEAPVPW